MADDQIPSWVPEFAPGIHADVYPVEPNQSNSEDSPAELCLSRHTVTHGYYERKQYFEFSSCLPAQFCDFRHPPPLSSTPAPDTISRSTNQSNSTSPSINRVSGAGLSQSDLHKLKNGLATLRRSRPAKVQRIEQRTFPQIAPNNESRSSFSSKKAFPLQKHSASSSFEDWFNKLGSGANYSTSELSRAVPLGPAIVRAAGKVIEMMALKDVPTQRAAWYVRIAVLNECLKQIRPDRPAPSPRTLWTRQLCTLLKTEIDAIRSRKTAMLGTMPRPKFWEYVLDLARWQADESLLDVQTWIAQIAAVLRTELVASQSFIAPGTKIATLAAWKFLPEFVATPENARTLCDALLPGTNLILKAWKASLGGSRDQTTSRGGKATVKKNNKRSPWVQDRCHIEVARMLQIALHVLDTSVEPLRGELKLSDLEKLIKKGVEIVVSAKKANALPRKTGTGKDKSDSSASGKSTSEGQRISDPIDKRISSHSVIREFELLSTHGDVARTVTVLRAAHQPNGGLQEQINNVCKWAIDSPVCDRDEAICVATAVLQYLAETTKVTPTSKLSGFAGISRRMKRIGQVKTLSRDPSFTPSIHREIWEFMKHHSKERKAENLDEELSFVKFIAQLCRTGLLSLSRFVRDISILTSCGHPGTSYLVKALSLLPDPVDKSISDCRRSLLSKYGFNSLEKTSATQIVEEKMMKAIQNGDMALMEQSAKNLVDSSHTNVILSIAEALFTERISEISHDDSNLHRQIFARASFFLCIGEAPICVEWLLTNIIDLIESGSTWRNKDAISKRMNVAQVLFRLLEDLSRYIAASGQLETTFILLKIAWNSSWVSTKVRRQILHTCAALGRAYTPKAGNRSTYWIKVVFKHLRQGNEPNTDTGKMTSLAVAALRGIEVDPDAREPPLSQILDASNKENWGMSPEDDLTTCLVRNQILDTEVADMQSQFTTSPADFPLDSYLLRGITGNDLFASIFTPKLADALSEQRAEHATESAFSEMAVAVLNIIEQRQKDVRFQSIRPTVLVDFIAVLVAGCISEHTDTSITLEELIGIKWVWMILAPPAGIILARRLRTRVDTYVSKIPHDKIELSQLLFNMVTRFASVEARDEAQVSEALGEEPFGMIEMQLSLLATHRKEGGSEEEFGSRIGDAAIAMVCRDSAKILASTALKCYNDEESRHVVAGLVGYDAAKAMVESLNFVVTGLTAEAQKNSIMNRKRAEQWAQVDRARRGILECIVGSLSQEVGVQVEAVLFEQLITATSQLEAASKKNCLPSSLLEDGRHISEAIESRLECILRSHRTPQTAEMWRQRTIQIATLLKIGVPVLRRGAINSATNVLTLCLKHLGDAGREETGSVPTSLNQVLERGPNRDVKRQLEALLSPTLLWIPPMDRECMARLIPRSLESGANGKIVQAYDASGEDVDSWLLLEGYGRGPDEESAISPSTFWRQGEGRFEKEEGAPAVQLKRTYSTFSSLAV